MTSGKNSVSPAPIVSASCFRVHEKLMLFFRNRFTIRDGPSKFDDRLLSIKLADIGKPVSALTNCTMANVGNFEKWQYIYGLTMIAVKHVVQKDAQQQSIN